MIELRLLQTSDIHGYLRGHDYLADMPSQTMGLARTATLIRRARAEAANSLFFDSGDLLLGSPCSDLVATRGLAPGEVHPVIAAMNALGLDAATLGNHDFDHGLDHLREVVDSAAFPITIANLARHDGKPTRFPGHVLLDRNLTDTAGNAHALRIAVIGCLPPQTTSWNARLGESHRIGDMVTAVAREAAAAREAGADLVIALAHTGLDAAPEPEMAENAILPIAALGEVDAVLGGHSHIVFPGPAAPASPEIDGPGGFVHGKPVTMPGFWGNHLGQIDLRLERRADVWAVASSRVACLPIYHRDAAGHIVATTSEDPELLTLSKANHERSRTHFGAEIGYSELPLHSFFSLIRHDSALEAVAQAQCWYLDAMTKGTSLPDLPVLCAVAPFQNGLRAGVENYCNIPAGPLTRRHAADLYYYPNRFRAVVATGAYLRHWLEHSASLYTRLTPGRRTDAPLLDPDVPGYKFDVISGLDYLIDLSQPARFCARGSVTDPAATRVRDVRWNGQPLDEAQRFLVATNSYRVDGIGFPPLPGAPDLASPETVISREITNREIVERWIEAESPVHPVPEHLWRFAPLGGATALFETSPAARAHLDEPGLPQLEDLGDTAQGFAVFRVTL